MWWRFSFRSAALLCPLVELLSQCSRAPLWAAVVERYAGAGWLGEADGDVADGRVGDFTPVLCALFPFLFRHVLVSVGVVPVGEVAAPVLRVEGFRVRGVFGEYLEYDSVVVGSAHDDRVVENIYWGERAPCALFEFAHALVECVDFIEIAAPVNVGNSCGEDALVVGGKVREERFVSCGVDVFL